MPRFPDFGRPHDKTLRGVSDIAEWIARDESQRRAVAGLQDFRLIGFDDGGGFHLIFEFALWTHDVHFVALPYIPQLAKESIAMACQNQIATLAWTRRPSQVAHSARERIIARSLEYHGR